MTKEKDEKKKGGRFLSVQINTTQPQGEVKKTYLLTLN
jgi:hypothetical protein